jgi:hypothetical protein
MASTAALKRLAKLWPLIIAPVLDRNAICSERSVLQSKPKPSTISSISASVYRWGAWRGPCTGSFLDLTPLNSSDPTSLSSELGDPLTVMAFEEKALM